MLGTSPSSLERVQNSSRIDRWARAPSITRQPEASWAGTEFDVGETNTPFATHYSKRETERREALVLSRSPTTPKQVYHLYTSYQEAEGFPPVVQLRRTYLQSELANLHDAGCWLLDRVREHSHPLRWTEHTAYCERSGGKCRKVESPLFKDSKVSYCAWTVEVQLF